MATLDQVIDQMRAAGLPELPGGHPLLDGRIHRFGPKKKAWYVLRDLQLHNGKIVVTGSFGSWQGNDNNAIAVHLDWERISDEERAEIERKQAEHQRAEEEQKRRDAELAANRARSAWAEAGGTSASAAEHPYLLRKRVAAEGTRVDAKGVLLIPARKYSRDGAALAGLQKIAPDGSKRFSTGMDMIGACCLLGKVGADTPVIGIAEGYATGQTVRMATECALPVMVAFNAGNLLPVARQLRHDFPGAHLLFLADDDMRIVARLGEALRDDYDVTWEPVIDGADHALEASTGDIVTVRARWRTEHGTPYIEADIRAGRSVKTRTFKNAGISCARAAAREVGNASVVWPRFAERSDDTWSDFNDLYLAESLEAVRAQIDEARSRALDPETRGAESSGGGNVPDDIDAAPPVGTPSAPSSSGEPGSMAVPTPEVLLSHFCLIYPTTDVWDSLRKQRLKKSAFTAWVGKELATQWEKDPKRRTILRESLPTLVGGRAVEGGAGGGKLGEMLDNLTLLRGTETVWDAIGQQVMSLGAVRADYTAELTSKWQEHALRKTIEAKNLVFDPTQQADPVTHVNIFGGWPLIPCEKPELVAPILALLASLCEAEDQVEECVEWILRWLAFPLQHPGAKMQTALLMFGEKQGTGKSLFFQDVMLPIYGEYGGVASQHQLDSTFTAWRSRKLFMLFEEVLSRDDRYSHNGTLKYMITGKSMSINQKNLPERDERNHMNSAFLSNEPQPIPIELEDRRFMVIEARRKQGKEFYDAVQAAIAAGGCEAFYQFLLTLPLDGFNEHTKPPMTLAKERVIEFGLNSWMSFHRAWKDGYLDAPYCSCLSEDLYIVYKRWCDRSGEKPLTLCKFAGLIASREHKTKRNVAVGKKGKTTRMVFIIDNPADDPAETLEQKIERFRDLADIRAHGALQG